jgi:hypothetical protein
MHKIARQSFVLCGRTMIVAQACLSRLPAKALDDAAHPALRGGSPGISVGVSAPPVAKAAPAAARTPRAYDSRSTRTCRPVLGPSMSSPD